MRAVVVEQWGEPAELRAREAPEPSPEPGMLTVEVRAAGVNFFDTLLVQGKYQVKPAFPFVPGAELAGEVLAVGAGVGGFRAGDRVMSSLPYGAFAERVNVPAPLARPIFDGMPFEQAAAFPIVYPTSHAALVHRARLEPGETVLVTAAAGGVGLSSVQIAKALGARVIALAGGEQKLEVARLAGADVAIDYREPEWVERVRVATDGRGADVIVENVGGDVFDGCMRCIAWGGRLVVVGFAGGKIPELKLNRVLLKHIAIVGLHWGPMLQHERDKVDQSQLELEKLYAAGKIRPVIWKTFPLERVGDALAAIASRESYGKIVITT
jgi:NADPH2:quinone reductase